MKSVGMARIAFFGVLCAVVLIGCAPKPTPRAEAPISFESEATAPVFETDIALAQVTDPPEQAKRERPRRFLGFLRREKPANPDVIVAPAATQEEVADGESRAIQPSMTDEEIAAAGVVSEVTPPSRRPRLFGFLQKRVPGEVGQREPALVAAVETDVEPSDGDAAELFVDAGPSMTDAEIAALGPPPGDVQQPSRRPRLFGFLQKRVPGEVGADDDGAPVIVAAAPLVDGEVISDAGPPVRDGRAAGVLPFGDVIRVCDVKRRDLGQEVARGSGGFRLFDRNPSVISPRSQFLTGFKDGCARQFTAALALFGSPLVHEATRYARGNSSAYSRVDIAYEKVKNRICGVRRGEFCPSDRVGRLEKETAFLTVYPDFGGTSDWLEIFLHKGQLVAYQTRSR